MGETPNIIPHVTLSLTAALEAFKVISIYIFAMIGDGEWLPSWPRLVQPSQMPPHVATSRGVHLRGKKELKEEKEISAESGRSPQPLWAISA